MDKKKYNRDKVKNEYENRNKDNGNISPPPQFIENERFVKINNKLNTPSSSNYSSNSSSSSSSSSSSDSPSNSSSSSSSTSSFDYLSEFIPFVYLTSSNLRYSVGALMVMDADSNN
jgi:cytoskeletal protein RodZ